MKNCDRDQLLGPALRLVREGPPAGEAPDDDHAGKTLNRRIQAEADQGDRAGDDPGDHGDDALHRHVDEARPREPLRLARLAQISGGSMERDLRGAHPAILRGTLPYKCG
jgi:hypothetical protein